MGPGFVCSRGCTAAPLTGGLWFHCIDVQDLQGTVVASLAQCSGDWLVLGGTWPVLGGTGWFVVVMGQYGAVLVGTWWYWVSIEQCWLVCGSNGSVWGGTGWYLVVLGQYRAVLVGLW